MSDPRSLLERESRRFIQQDGAFERLQHLRDRKRRNQRIAAGVVGIAVFVTAVWIVTSGLPSHQTGMPAAPSESPAIQSTSTPTPLVGNRNADYLLDLETGETTPLPEEIRGDWFNGYTVSPDGSEVAYYRWAGRVEGPPLGPSLGEDGTQALFVAHIDGTHVRQIADDAVVDGGGGGYADTGPAWSPNGTRIAYTGLPTGDRNANVFVIDLTTG